VGGALGALYHGRGRGAWVMCSGSLCLGGVLRQPLVHPLSTRGHQQANHSVHLRIFHKRKEQKFLHDNVKAPRLIFSQPHSM